MDTEENISATIKLDRDLLEKADAKAKALDLNRSQYLRRLIREDLAHQDKELHPAHHEVAA